MLQSMRHIVSGSPHRPSKLFS